MENVEATRRLREEVARASSESRAALGAMAERCELPHPLMGVCSLIDRVNFDVTWQQGDASFELDEDGTLIAFRAQTLKSLIEKADDLADEIGYMENEERIRVVQLAINLFVVHELIHVAQNCPDFGSVPTIKRGLPILGLPMLDVAADAVSAWVCAHVESERLDQRERIDILRTYVNMLILAYAVGAFVFDIEQRAPKIQRALGLVLSAALTSFYIDEKLNMDVLYSAWTPTSPLLLIDLSTTKVFNALVIDRVPGLLLNNFGRRPEEDLEVLWRSAGRKPVTAALELMARELVTLGLVTT